MHELIVGCIGSYNNECFSQDTVTCIAYSCPSAQLIDLTSCDVSCGYTGCHTCDSNSHLATSC